MTPKHTATGNPSAERRHASAAADTAQGRLGGWAAVFAAVWAFNLLGAAFAAYVYFGGPLP